MKQACKMEVGEKTCWYEAVVGVDRDDMFCDGFDPVKCEGCPFFLPDPPMMDDGQDELPSFE